MRDHYATLLLNMRIPEPASIQFYGKYLSGEDFCNNLRLCDMFRRLGEDAGGRSMGDVRTGTLQGQLGRNFMCILAALKVYGCYVLKANV